MAVMGRPRIYPLNRMKIGDTFVVKLRHMGHRVAVSSTINFYEKRNPERFRTKLLREGNLLVTRVA